MRTFTRNFVILFLLLPAFACRDDSSGRATQVGSVSNIRYTAAQGALLFQWDNPEAGDVAYVEISYTDKSGNLHRTLALGGASERWVEGLPDSSPYYFRFVVYDKAGKVSEPVELMASALESTVNMFYGRVKLGVDLGGINVSWENSYAENFYIELTYTDLNGNDYKEEVVVAAHSTGKQLVRIGANVSGSQSLDVYATIVDEHGNESDRKMLRFYKKEAGKLDRSKWSVVAFSSEEPQGDGGCFARYILDGNLKTYWHSKWNTTRYPHYIVLDLGSQKMLEKIGIFQRQDRAMVSSMAIYGNNVSGTPSSESSWTLCHEFNLTTSAAEQIFEFPNVVRYRFVKVVCTLGFSGGNQNDAALAEVYLYGSDVADE
ncbi:MAG: discoidin domain-containing protein [Odoribacter sp.]|nr:discoidin domain-containing protein [Odoribacter sp.]